MQGACRGGQMCCPLRHFAFILALTKLLELPTQAVNFSLKIHKLRRCAWSALFVGWGTDWCTAAHRRRRGPRGNRFAATLYSANAFPAPGFGLGPTPILSQALT